MDVVGRVGGQPRDRATDILRLPDTPVRNKLQECAERLGRLERRWPFLLTGLVVLALLGAGAVALALAALRRRQQAERYASTTAAELDEKRKVSLAERQESARRILDLEARIRHLEAQIGPRVQLGGRSGS